MPETKLATSAEQCPHGREPAWCLPCIQATLPQCAGCGRHAILNYHCSRCGARFCSPYCLDVIHVWRCKPQAEATCPAS